MSADDLTDRVLKDLITTIQHSKSLQESVYHDVVAYRSLDTLKYLLEAGLYYFGLSGTVARGELEKMKFLLDNYGVNYDGRDDDVLLDVAKYGDLTTLRLLLGHFETHRLPTESNVAEVLCAAARSQDFEFYRTLYEFFGDRVKGLNFGRQLMSACQGHDQQTIDFLLSLNPSGVDNGAMAAAEVGRIETVRRLSDKIMDHSYLSCMFALIRKSDIGWMMERGAPLLSPADWTILLDLAASYARYDFVATYIDRVIDPVSVLRHAVCGPSIQHVEYGITEKGRPELVDLLMIKFGNLLSNDVVADLIAIVADRNWIRTGNVLYSHRPVQPKRLSQTPTAVHAPTLRSR